MKVELDDAVADAKCAGDLHDAEALNVEQRQRESLLARQCRELRGHVRAIGPVDSGGSLLDLQQLYRALLAAKPAVFVAELVNGHPSNPPHRVVVVRDSTPMQVGLDESLLHSIGSSLLLAAHHG